MHVSHFSRGVLTQGLDVVSKEKKGRREENSDEKAEVFCFLGFFVSFPNVLKSESRLMCSWYPPM